jgi:hypothetical protein
LEIAVQAQPVVNAAINANNGNTGSKCPMAVVTNRSLTGRSFIEIAYAANRLWECGQLKTN